MKRIIIGILILLFTLSLFAESFEETLQSLSGDAAESYVSPIVSAFGSDMNGGWFHKVPKKSFLGINVEFGMVTMLSMFPDDDKSFNTTGEFYITRAQATELVDGVSDVPQVQDALIEKLISEPFTVGISGATIIGPEDDHVMIDFYEKDLEVSYDTPGGEVSGTYTVPGQSIDTGVGGYLDGVKALPLVAPQLGVGTFMGTKAYLRYLPTMDFGDFGEFSYWGVGLQHNVKAWMPVPIPIDVSLAAFTQRLKIGDIVEANATTFGVNAGKTIGLRFLSFTPYAGLMYETSKMKFSYNYLIGDNPITGEPVEQKISFEMEGENSSRLVLGSSFRFGVFNLSADYNIAKYSSATASFGIAF